MKPIEFSQHVQDQLADRGVTREEIVKAIQEGERVPAKRGRLAFRKNFPFEARWKEKFYEVKQVIPIVAEKGNRLVVVTVYAFYFGGED